MDEVTATQAARLTGLSERTIRRKIAAGQLAARRIAPNRYAIRVQDLPQRLGIDDLTTRVGALEHRVRLLELRLGTAYEVESPTPAGAADASLMPLRELLAQLAREAERLGPLLAPTRSEGETGVQEPEQARQHARRGHA